MNNRKINPDYLRNIFFGIEDGFVSTAGIMFGIATATTDKYFILAAGIITVLVEATSMGIGAYLSEKSTEEFAEKSKRLARPLLDGLVMFLAYAIAGVLCVFPYSIWDIYTGRLVSVIITLSGLFFIGFYPRKRVKGGIEVALLGGVAVVIGYLSGLILQTMAE